MTDVITSADVRTMVPMADAITAVREAFLSFARNEFDVPVRSAFGGGTQLVMPVYHRASGSAAVKTVRIDGSREVAITGMIVWSDERGEVVMDARDVTALRTGAVVGVAVDLLAPRAAERLVVIGAGAQALDQVRAVLAVRPIGHVTVVSRRENAVNRFRDLVAQHFPYVTVKAATDPAVAVRAADIVCCATSSLTPVFDAADLPDRVLVCGIGSYTLAMSELPEGAFLGADVVVDDVESALAESGELVGAMRRGLLARSDLSTLGRRLEAPRAPSARTVFKSVGLAVQDWAIASIVADRVRRRAG